MGLVFSLATLTVVGLTVYTIYTDYRKHRAFAKSVGQIEDDEKATGILAKLRVAYKSSDTEGRGQNFTFNLRADTENFYFCSFGFHDANLCTESSFWSTVEPVRNFIRSRYTYHGIRRPVELTHERLR